MGCQDTSLTITPCKTLKTKYDLNLAQSQKYGAPTNDWTHYSRVVIY